MALTCCVHLFIVVVVLLIPFHRRLDSGCAGGQVYSQLLSQIYSEHLILGKNGKQRFFLLIFAPTLEEANASVTLVCEDSGAFCICDPIQVAEEPTTLRLEICPEVERYNPLLGDVSVMEKQAGHLHVEGFKIGGTPGKLHTLKFSEA